MSGTDNKQRYLHAGHRDLQHQCFNQSISAEQGHRQQEYLMPPGRHLWQLLPLPCPAAGCAAALQPCSGLRSGGAACHESSFLVSRKLPRWRPGPGQQVWSLGLLGAQQAAQRTGGCCHGRQWLHPLHHVTPPEYRQTPHQTLAQRPDVLFQGHPFHQGDAPSQDCVGGRVNAGDG